MKSFFIIHIKIPCIFCAFNSNSGNTDILRIQKTVSSCSSKYTEEIYLE